VVSADGTTQALAACVTEVPDLIVLDIQLPDGNRMALASQLRMHGWVMPMLVMTATYRARWCAEEIEAEGWLAKPFELHRTWAMKHAMRSGPMLPAPPSHCVRFAPEVC
jgi:DNA-binding response OmpR family regulator